MSNQPNSILIAEDEAAMRKVLVDEFGLANFEVLEADNGEDALVQALEKKPAVILLDILMPKKDGLEVLSELRKDAWGKDAMVIMLTNVDTNSEILKKVAVLKPTYYLVKSNIKISDVIAKVTSLLNT